MRCRYVHAACAASLALGIFFITIWAPHPWGWEGFDEYHDLALALARGEAFPTMDRPWGYAYYLAAFYRVFGDRPVIPLLVQATLNGLMPLLVYAFARTEFDDRVAAVAALLTGVLSFNTVYASTQSADAVCNVVFMTAVVAFARARRHGDARLYAAAGVLLGIAAQFRPNLLFVPIVLASFAIVERRGGRRATVLIAASLVTLLPWIVRNYRLTGEIIPTSTRGGVQLWYGTLQSGPYVQSRAHNPRSVFETGPFPYTSLDRVPLVVTARVAACQSLPAPLAVVFWTDRDRGRHGVAAQWTGARTLRAELAPSPAPTTYYISFDGAGLSGHASPYVYFVSTDHLGDLDRHGDLLDVFDVVRLLRHVAWSEPVPFADRLDFDGDRRLTEADVLLAADALLAHAAPRQAAPAGTHVVAEANGVALRMADGSTLAVPRVWSGNVTDIEATGTLGAALVHSSVTFAALHRDRVSAGGTCAPIEDIAVNAPFYRAEPHAMRRYLALAFDNIRRDPAAYLAGVAYRTARVFFVEPSDDPHTTYQFGGSRRIYRAAEAASIAIVLLCAMGIAAARSRGAAIALPLALIAYIPATLAFVLTNMRYSITVQPLMFVFVAAAVVSAAEARRRSRDRGGTETARRP